MKVSELSGVELDYWVAKAVNKYHDVENIMDGKTASHVRVSAKGEYHREDLRPSIRFEPHKDWKQCGPLIKKFGISLDMRPSGKWDGIASKSDAGVKWQNYCDSPQEAICRAVVASVYGEEVSDD